MGRQDNPHVDAESALVALNTLLHDITSVVMKENAHASFFKNPVSVAQIPDFHQFVEPQEEMYLSKVQARTRSRNYTCAEDYRSDIEKVYHNAVAYNSKGCGQHSYEPVIHWAGELLNQVDDQLERYEDDVVHAEAMLREAKLRMCKTLARPEVKVALPAPEPQCTALKSASLSPSTSAQHSCLEFLLAACELAAEKEGMINEAQHYYQDVVAAEAEVGCYVEDAMETVQTNKHRRHKSKVFIRPNKVVYLPTTFMEDNFNPALLPMNCEMVVEADNKMMPETHLVTIKAVPRQGLSTMYCMTNVMKFQQQYLNWQILNWTKVDDRHIKIHLQHPSGVVPKLHKPSNLDRARSMPLPHVPAQLQPQQQQQQQEGSGESPKAKVELKKRKSDMGKYSLARLETSRKVELRHSDSMSANEDSPHSSLSSGSPPAASPHSSAFTHTQDHNSLSNALRMLMPSGMHFNNPLEQLGMQLAYHQRLNSYSSYDSAIKQSVEYDDGSLGSNGGMEERGRGLPGNSPTKKCKKEVLADVHMSIPAAPPLQMSGYDMRAYPFAAQAQYPFPGISAEMLSQLMS